MEPQNQIMCTSRHAAIASNYLYLQTCCHSTELFVFRDMPEHQIIFNYKHSAKANYFYSHTCCHSNKLFVLTDMLPQQQIICPYRHAATTKND